MAGFKLATLALLSLRALGTVAQAADPVIEEEVDHPAAAPQLAVHIDTSFPDSEIFGIKLVNGIPTQAQISVSNEEPESVSVQFVGGYLASLDGPKGPQIVRNLTVSKYDVEIPAGQKESLTYSFTTEMHPQDLTLFLTAMVAVGDRLYTVPAFNGTVSVVEAPTSIFDPQIIFLYLVLAAVFGGTCYFIYTTWIQTLFPQKRSRSKGGERSKRSSMGSRNADPADQTSGVGADGPAVTSGAKAYDESWIPASHLQRPEAKRVRGGTPSKTKTR